MNFSVGLNLKMLLVLQQKSKSATLNNTWLVWSYLGKCMKENSVLISMFSGTLWQSVLLTHAGIHRFLSLYKDVCVHSRLVSVHLPSTHTGFSSNECSDSRCSWQCRWRGLWLVANAQWWVVLVAVHASPRVRLVSAAFGTRKRKSTVPDPTCASDLSSFVPTPEAVSCCVHSCSRLCRIGDELRDANGSNVLSRAQPSLCAQTLDTFVSNTAYLCCQPLGRKMNKRVA